MIKVFLCNDSNPELIEPQHASFKKHLQEDFEFTVFNGGETLGLYPEKAKEVTAVCGSLGIRTVDVKRDASIEAYRNDNFTYGSPDRIFGANGRYTTAGNAGNYLMQWSWQRGVCEEKGTICYAHSDTFLIEPIKLSDCLKEHAIGSIPQHNGAPGVRYLWEPLILADMSKLPNPETMVWWPSMVEGMWADTGGPTYYYLKAHPELKVLWFGESGPPGPDDDDSNVDFHPARYRYIHLLDKRIFHYMSGSRWCTDSPDKAIGWQFSKEKADDYHAKKLAWTRKLSGL